MCGVFPDIVKDCPPKIRNLPKIFLRSFKNVGPKADQQTENQA